MPTCMIDMQNFERAPPSAFGRLRQCKKLQHVKQHPTATVIQLKYTANQRKADMITVICCCCCCSLRGSVSVSVSVSPSSSLSRGKRSIAPQPIHTTKSDSSTRVTRCGLSIHPQNTKRCTLESAAGETRRTILEYCKVGRTPHTVGVRPPNSSSRRCPRNATQTVDYSRSC